jgi:hypothetical protein
LGAAPEKTRRLPLVVRMALSLTVIFAMPMLLIAAQPVDDSGLRAFLMPPADCPAPCFLGIRPGVTTGTQALAILETHEWATNVQLETYTLSLTYGKLTWDWSAAAPEFADRARTSSITLRRQGAGSELAGTRVENMEIFTTVRMHLAQKILGEPDARSVGLRSGGLAYQMAYDSGSAITILSTILPCPANLLTYWEGRATLYLTIWAGPDHAVQPRTVVNMC